MYPELYGFRSKVGKEIVQGLFRLYFQYKLQQFRSECKTGYKERKTFVNVVVVVRNTLLGFATLDLTI